MADLLDKTIKEILSRVRAGICISIGILSYLMALNSTSYPNSCSFRMVDEKEHLIEFNI